MIEKRSFGLLGMAGALLLTLGSTPPAQPTPRSPASVPTAVPGNRALVIGSTYSVDHFSPFSETLLREQHRELGPELAGYLGSPDERLAARAALAIGRIKRAAGAAILLPHVSDPRAAVRAMSIYGLGLIADGSAAHQILLALDDSSGAVRAAALDAIGRYQSAGVFKPAAALVAARGVAARLREDADPLLRARAGPILSAFAATPAGDAAAQALVAAFNNDANVRVRRNAMWTVFRSYAIRIPRAVLTRALHDRDEVVRIEAARAYGHLKNADAIAALKPLLGDPSWRVQEQAAESLLALGGKAQTDHWTSIPPSAHLPAIAPDPLADLPALPRSAPAHTRPTAPTVGQAMLTPQLDPHTATDMSGPAPGAHPRVRIVTTKGNVYVTLFPEWAPLTVANFLNVADHGYYDNNRWFRIVPDFVVQTGDPTDTGDGDAGYMIGAEENPLEQQSGVISMGLNYDKNAPIRDSAGTQYYITLSPQLHLDRDFTVFGSVSGGAGVLAHLIESDRVVRIERIADVTL